MEIATIKPIFKLVYPQNIELPDFNLIFNSQRVGPMRFNDLRNADYGKGFRMPTFPELISLIYASFKNQEYKTAKIILRTPKAYHLTGNTGAHYFPEAMFVQDNPEMENGKIITPDYKTLESRLGKHEEKGVVFSDDKTIRFVPLKLLKNAGIIALVGGEENAEKLTTASEYHEAAPSVYTLSSVNIPQTAFVSLFSDDPFCGLDIFAYLCSDDFEEKVSFGVFRNDAKGVDSERM
jgi:hypothetical protein